MADPDIGLKNRISNLLQHFRKEADPYLNVVYWVLLFAAFPACLYWVIRIPSPGLAIGALGAVGVLLALRGDKELVGHKFFWSIITVLLLVTEVRAIHKDRQDQLDAHKAELKTQATQYENTLKAIVGTHDTQMKQNQTHFDETLSKMNALADSSQLAINLSQETINQTTGGDSWLEIAPFRDGSPPLSKIGIGVHGKYPFYADTLEIYDSSGLHKRRPTFPFPASNSLLRVINLSTYYPPWVRPLTVDVPITNERFQVFEFRIIGKFGMEQEWISLYRTETDWLTSGEAHRGKKIVYKWTDPGFPKDFKLEAPTPPLDPHLQP